VLHEQHRVVVADGGLEHPLGIVGCAGHGHVHAGEVGEDHLRRVGMGGGELLAAAGCRADDHRHGELAVEHVVHFSHVVDDSVHGHKSEVDGHDLGDGAQAGHCRADGRAGDHHLGDGRIAHAARAELVQEATGDGIRAAPDADLFAHDEDTLVALHFFAQSAAERLADGNGFLGHGVTSF